MVNNSNDLLRFDGVVEEALPGLMFRVVISPQGQERRIIAHLAGKMKIHRIRIIPGDRVSVEMPNAKDTRGRIVRRH
jgi:translation initiation factor IF-1